MPSRLHVGGRVIKTSLAVGLSVYVAQSLGLERVNLAAIVALVTVQRTFYSSLMQGLARLGSVILGALIGTVFALILGGTPFSFGLVTLAVIIISIQLNWQDNLVIIAVVAIGVISSQAENLLLFSLHQFATALIGAVVALGINLLFAPAYQRGVDKKLIEIESSLRKIMAVVASEMLHPDLNSDISRDIQQLQADIQEGLQISKLFREEQRFSHHRDTRADHYRDAFRVFISQAERLVEMHNLARRMIIEVPTAAPIAQLLRIMGYIQLRQLQGKNTHAPLLDRIIASLEKRFENLEMPHTRDEFVTRSSLVHLFMEVKKYYKRTLKMPPALAEGEIISGEKKSTR